MADASFNPTGAGGLTALIPATSGYLVTGVVQTVYREPPPRTQMITFPGIPGAVSIDYGSLQGQVLWRWWLEATSWSNLNSFEELLRSYQGAGRFTLESEIEGRTWSSVEFRRYEPEEPLQAVVGGGVLRVGLVTFEWMAPG